MEKLIIDLIPFLIPALIAALGWLWKKFVDMSERIVVMETNMTTCKTNMDEDVRALKEKIESEVNAIHKTIEKVQQRQDSHSKKQDETQKMITELDVKMITKFGEMAKELSSIASDVKYINMVFKLYVTDDKMIVVKKDD